MAESAIVQSLLLALAVGCAVLLVTGSGDLVELDGEADG